MKKALLTLALVLGMSSAVFASEDEKIAELEQRIAALEAAVFGLSDDVIGESELETALSEAKTCYSSAGYSLEYEKCELTRDIDNNDCVIIYFMFTNISGDPADLASSYIINVYQNDKEMEVASVEEEGAYAERYTKLKSGEDPLEVALAFAVNDKDDIVVRIQSVTDLIEEPVEFTESFK